MDLSNPMRFLLLYPAAALVSIFILHVIWYLFDPHRIRDIPGPFLARLSDVWLFLAAYRRERAARIHDLHHELGPFVRIAPNHVSVARPEALNAVYGHSSGTVKSDFYDAFTGKFRTVFSTRDRAEHSRKRKIHSNGFSQRVLLEYEPLIRDIAHQLVRQFDRMYDEGIKGGHGPEGEDGGWYGREGRAWLEITGWTHYFAFDVISSLAFGGAFGMVENGRGIARAAKASKGGDLSISEQHSDVDMEEIPIVAQSLQRPRLSTLLGTLPLWLRILIAKTVLTETRRKALFSTLRIAAAAVETRKAKPTDRRDLLSNLLVATDDEGRKLEQIEVLSESLSLLIAGSDTTSNSAAVIVYHLAKNINAQARLQTELDEVLGADIDPVPTYEQVKHLPYLEAVIEEGLRLAATVPAGLPRVVPEGGLTVLDKHFTTGTILSVPTYTLHNDPEVFGDDVHVFRPERWLESEDRTHKMHKSMNTFSLGPRACIGRHLAMIELNLLLTTLMRRYSFVLQNPNVPLKMEESFLNRPLDNWVGLIRRF